MTKDILCCILNHNRNEESLAWKNRLSPYFETLVLDSGSVPACSGDGVVNLPNVYYSGLLNTAYELLCKKGCKWLVIVTSDIEINERNTRKLVASMKKIARSTNVALYQPSCRLSFHGRALLQSMCHYSGRMRSVNFQEGWFHMVRRDVIEKIMPVDTGVNLLGWGTDLALSHFARKMGLLVIVDDTVMVVHPKGTGYNKKEALRQMRAWHSTIQGYESPRHFPPRKGPILFAED